MQERRLPVLEAVAAQGIVQRHLIVLYQSLLLGVIDYKLGRTIMSQTNVKNWTELKTVSEGHAGHHQGYIRQRVDQVKAWFSALD